jgi:uncharacterized damage-inducible protein DinB
MADGYDRTIAGADPGFLSGTVRFPWMTFEMTRHDALMQALMHSIHHRAQAFSALGARGFEVPDLDYPFMLRERLASA